MFAVPGWNLAASSLKTQINTKPLKATKGTASQTQKDTTEKKSRKRKRGNGSTKNVEVTEENLGELWRKHMEGKIPKGNKNEKKDKEGRGKRKEKTRPEEGDEIREDAVNGDRPGFDGFSDEGKESELATKEDSTGKERQDRSPVVTNGHTIKPDTSNTQPKEHLSKAESKAKYEERKAKAARKREQKQLLRANGTLPPSRLTAPSSSTAKKTTPDPSKSPSNTTQEPNSPTHLNHTQLNHSAHSPAPPPSLTPLQTLMAQKLLSSRFRHLNATLYTTPSTTAAALFVSPHLYESYHVGFRNQVATWPSNPLETFIHDLKTRGRVKPPRRDKPVRGRGARGRGRNITPRPTRAQAVEEPLPRDPAGQCRIIDLGCGDAGLAASLLPLCPPHALNLHITSFDLNRGIGPHAHLITPADITDLGKEVRDQSVDVAVCCLSLMGTDWVKVVGECGRVVRGGGEVWVAEVASRFVGSGGVAVSARGGGMGGRGGAAGQRGGGFGGRGGGGRGGGGAGAVKQGHGDADADADGDLEAGAEAKGREADVGPFVGVWERRGFRLRGEVERGNKMFVTLRFVRVSEGGGEGERGGGVDQGGVEDEGRVLKPCVYKTR